jgi:hypothetical protein
MSLQQDRIRDVRKTHRFHPRPLLLRQLPKDYGLNKSGEQLVCKRSPYPSPRLVSNLTGQKFKLLKSSEYLKVYIDNACDSGGTVHRGLCSSCGSTMMSENKEKFPGSWIVPSGALDIDPTEGVWKPQMEYYVKRKATWLSTPEETKKFGSFC